MHNASTRHARWTLAGSPHVVLGPVTGAITIEAGAVVCIASNLWISPDRLVAVGTADLPIRFMPLDTADSWRGIEIPYDAEPAEFAHVRIRRTTGPAIRLGAGTIRFAVIDSACIGMLECYAISGLDNSGGLTIEETIIRDSGGGGIRMGNPAALRISGGSIERSAGIGLVVPGWEPEPATVFVGAPVRITAGCSYPAVVTLPTARALTRDAAAAAGLMGNAKDTLLVSSYYTVRSDGVGMPTVIRKGLAWKVSTIRGLSLGILQLGPGSHLTLSGAPGYDDFQAQLQARGTATDPVTVRGDNAVLRIEGTESSYVDQVNFFNVLIDARAPATFSNGALSASTLNLSGTGSRLLDSNVGGTAQIAPLHASRYRTRGAVTLGPHTTLERTRVQATGLHGVVTTGTGVTLNECTISGNAGDGVRVEQGAAIIRNCNLESNTGAGVANLGGTPVDAVNNWWGDPAGPLGPSGDGVAGAVRVDSVRTAPVKFGAALASVRVFPATGHNALWRWDGTTWRDTGAEPIGPGSAPYRLARFGNDVFVSFHHFNGVAWHPMFVETKDPGPAVWTSADDVFVLDRSIVLHGRRVPQ